MLRLVLIEDGHEVTALASDFLHIEKKKRDDHKDGYVYFEAIPYQKNLSIQRIRSYTDISAKMFRYVEENIEKFDLLWIVFPPNTFVRDAYRLKQEHPEVKIVLDLIDLWPESMPVGISSDVFPMSVWKNRRDKYIGCADHFVSECDLFRTRIAKAAEGIPATTIYLARTDNGYAPDLHLDEDSLHLCYLGSVNNIIDIDAVGNILRELNKCKPVTMHVIGGGEKIDLLLDVCRQNSSKLEFHGKVFDRDEKKRILDGCHYGLNVMKKTVCVGLTMKSMDYIEFGLPVINNIEGDTWDIIDRLGIGYNIGDGTDYGRITDYDVSMRGKVREFFEKELTCEVFDRKVRSVISSVSESK